MWYTCFVANRNLTLSLPEELVRRAKIHAAEHDSTVDDSRQGTAARGLVARQPGAGGRRSVSVSRRQRCLLSVDPASIRRDELYERR